VLNQQLLIDAWFVIKTFQVCFCDEPTKIPVSFFILDKENQMIVSGPLLIGRFVETAFRRHINFTSQNGFDLFFLGLPKKTHGSKNIAVIGKGHGRHFVFVGGLHERRRLQRTVENAEF